MVNFKKIAEQATSLSPLMEGRKKLNTQDMIERFPDGFTIEEFDMISLKDSFFPIVTFKEDPDSFYYGGKVMSKICEGWINEFDGSISDASEELKKYGGVRVKLEKASTKTGNNLTKVTIL